MNEVFHTKYRPTKFEDVVGQEHVVNSLRQVMGDKRAHTFLFTGPSGVGKTTLARILATTMAQRKTTQASIEEIDGATNSGIDAMRDVVRRSNYRALGALPVKTIIVDECHKLSSGAWSVLLKATEEPPAHVYWAFCTTEPDKVPKTVKTRCLHYNLRPVSEEAILDLLATVIEAENLNVKDEVVLTVAENAAGSPRQALVYLEMCLHAGSAGQARLLMGSGFNSKETIDLCRWLVSGRTANWPEAVKYLKALEGNDAESIRITVANYLTVVLMNTKDNGKAVALLRILEPFLSPFVTSDKLAPLMHAVGLAIGLDRL